MNIRNQTARLMVVAIVLAGQVATAAEGKAPRFAAPDVASSLPSGGASGIGQVTLALLVVLAAVFAAAWFVKRLRMATGRGVHGIEVLAQSSLGAKERAVIVRVGGERLLLGVASGGVSLLRTLPPELAEATPPATTMEQPGFAALLKKSLGR